MNLLDKKNSEIQSEILNKINIVSQKRESSGYVSFCDYSIEKLRKSIVNANNDIENIDDIQIEFIDRKQFNADIAIKIPSLMKGYGIPKYTKETIPQIIANIEKSTLFNKEIIKLEAKGIYLNITLGHQIFKEIINDTLKLSGDYGFSDVNKSKKIVLDYSSPNIAKHLHTGHIHSTIIGEVLAEIYESTGFTVHRLNYLNDWGGMGALIEAYSKLKTKNVIPKLDSDNSILDYVYQLVRKAEKSNEAHSFEKLLEDNKIELTNLVGDFTDIESYKNKYSEFKNKSIERFQNLENGEKEEYELWQLMRGWSLVEFNKFYELLNIKHDYLLGESFYGKKGVDFVKEKLKTGEVVIFTKELADIETKKAQLKFESNTIELPVLEKLLEEINNDIGAYVVMLPSSARLVIMRADGATIYATRDLVSIKHRIESFSPSRLLYVVGQEQSEHFKHIFEAATTMNLSNGANIDLKHLSHGFYIDADTKQKLSSREGAQNVISLIEESIKYFRNKYDEKIDFSDEEKNDNAKKLAVGSIAFNDIKQDKRFPIPFHKELIKNIQAFEESGGAYVMYSIARAKSILRKSDKKITDLDIYKLDLSILEPTEINLLKKIADLPKVILKASETDNPATLAEYLLNLANEYNSYYENADVLLAGKLEYPHRLFITHAVAVTLSNGLKLCHAEAPERI
ncbi:MAG: arginine--tRNA ligase [bacterium]